MAESQTSVSNSKSQDEIPARADRYDPTTIELKWFERWAQNPDLYKSEPSTSSRKKYYVL